MKKFTPHLKLLPALLLGFMGSPLWAAGFQLQNQNGAGTGLSYAGQAANPEDASTVFFNPAGMTHLPQGQHISLGGTIIDRSVKFTDTGTTPMPVINPLNGLPTGAFHPVGGSGDDGGGASLVPNFFYTRSLDARTVIGLGVSATYGSETEYDSNFAGRFSGRYTSIHQININPSIAWKLDERLSLGLGLNFAHNKVEFKVITPYVGAPEGILQGKDSALGWNAGLMYQLTPNTRVGVSYRSKMKFHLEGSQRLAAFGVNQSINANLTTPDNLSLALSHKSSDRLEWLADLTHTGWSSVQQLTPYINGTTTLAAAPLKYNFKNTWRLGVGLKYQYNPTWSLRTGIAFDESPVPDAASRTMTVPDSDRTWLSFGARMKIDNQSSLDMGYAHLWLKNSSTARLVTSTGGTPLQIVRGDFKSSVNLLSVQYNRQF